MSGAVDRRAFLTLLASGVGATLWPIRIGGQTAMPAGRAADHLILGCADLDAGVEWFEKRSGVRAGIGGSHPGRGTRNALLALSGRQYLEILAPDPAQGAAARSDLRDLREPRLIGWAAATNDVASVDKRITAAGLKSSGLRPGSRARPDGRLLRWTTVGLESRYQAGLLDPIPFFIQWDAASVHPSEDSPKGCELIALEFEHPDAESLRRTFTQLGIESVVRPADPGRMVATIRTPKGSLRLT